MSEAAAKREIQKLQRAIVDGLEDVKGHDIRVFNTEHLSPLFERVIIASGTSNRQTQSLAASVRDKVREAGFAKPRLEGEENGEWIIIDCGAAVAHVMQPAIRQFYNLEEIWGDKPVRVRLGGAPASRATSRRATTSARGSPTETVSAPTRKRAPAKAPTRPATARPVARKAAAAGRSAASGSARATAASTPRKAAAGTPAAKKPAARVVTAGKPTTARKAAPARPASATRKTRARTAR